MKKAGVYLSLSSFFTVLGTSLVSAASTSDALKPLIDFVSGTFNAIIDAINPLLKYIIGDTPDAGLFLAKIVMLIIVYTVVYYTLGKMNFFEGDKNTRWGRWVISLAVGIIGIRFLSVDFVYNFILSNGAFAIAVTAGLPFLLFFYLVRGWTPIARRVAWIFFAAGMLLFDIYLYKKINGAAAAFYPVIAVISILMAVFDGTIQRFWNQSKIERAKSGAHAGIVISTQKKMSDITSAYESNMQGYVGVYTGYGKGKTGSEAYDSDMQYLTEQLKKYI